MDEGPPPDPTLSSREWHERVKHVFVAVLDAPAGKRAVVLAELCAGDAELHAEVFELLMIQGDVDSLLDHPLDGAAALEGLATPPGGTIGPFRVVRELGHGGMGVVHLAERDGEMFAVKLLAAGAVSPEARERFRLEAEILGRLHHEGIARIVDVGEVQGFGGVSQPWIAMEYVEGIPFHEYVQRAELHLEDRLQLLVRVCEAVQHAHVQGVVHRDLKPANILVRKGGRPVVLDFGVARLMVGDERPTELATRVGQLIGTPQYMSPEQVQANPASISTASDVYSLGVIAYELCAGQLPYEASTASMPSFAVILTKAPPRLGTIDRRFRGALENIVSMALEKEPGRRYADAGELADDLGRKLAGRPVRARGPGLLRTIAASALLRRLSAVAVLLLIVGLIATVLLMRARATVPRERVLATYREAETAALQAVPLLYEGERTPSRLRQAIDLYSRARQLIDQVPPLRTHDALMRFIEKDLGTAQFLLGELTWDLQPYRASALTLEHAVTLAPGTPTGWQQDIQLPQFGVPVVPQRELDGLLTSAYLGEYRLWGESNALLSAQRWLRQTRVDIRRECGPPPPTRSSPYAPSWDAWAFYFNSLTEVTDEAARFRADTSIARSAMLFSDSAVARRSSFLQDWPALGSLLFERGRAFRTVGELTDSQAALDSSRHYLRECADYRGPERPWVFAQTRQEMACLALAHARLERDPAAREALLHQALRDVDSALSVLRPTELPVAASASLHSLDAELLAELSVASGRPALLGEADARLREASRAFPSTALPREAAWVCVRQALLARARFAATADRHLLDAGDAALDRAQVLMESHQDSLVMFRIRRERVALARARAGG